ncbi:hypothetical protein [Pseudogulbenkiania subflava]|uniref:Uncharacterized protein n=1 Tax=Pseudogulbenkiania subflava DSM 22618 TaxID=1123014 RepID=A0A1Y6CFR7_9NEIS|nr:hypothetical protein [Pseudogulbenkiania subflava]SMF53322.1 hypothetical protein SAMN02745746_03808 [Pseudogulbenkiania subflava DSM 22618]
MANSVGRPKGLPKALNSGRKKGTRNSKPRTPDEVRERIRLDIIAAYESEGGVEWLKKIIRDHPLAFLSQAFSRIAPVAPKPDEAIPSNTTVNVNQLNTLDLAKYIAFALNSALHENPARVIDHQPGPAKPYTPEAAAPVHVSTDSLEEQARQAAARDLVANTIEQDVTTYHGSSREQGIVKKRNLI